MFIVFNTAHSPETFSLHQFTGGFCSQQRMADNLGLGVRPVARSFAAGRALQIVVRTVAGLAGASHSRAVG
jgi:hypothetical protein